MRQQAESLNLIVGGEPSTTPRTESNDDENISPGFIFLQLGILQGADHWLYNEEEDEDWEWEVGGILEVLEKGPVYYKEGEGPPWDDKRWGWEDTNFNIVARIRRETGRIEGIYVVCNSLRVGDVNQYDQEDGWAFSCGEIEGPFFVARIGDSLGAMGFTTEMMFVERIEWPVEIVRVRPAGNRMGVVRERVGGFLVEVIT